jgi:hypothetical protein
MAAGEAIQSSSRAPDEGEGGEERKKALSHIVALMREGPAIVGRRFTRDEMRIRAVKEAA